MATPLCMHLFNTETTFAIPEQSAWGCMPRHVGLLYLRGDSPLAVAVPLLWATGLCISADKALLHHAHDIRI